MPGCLVGWVQVQLKASVGTQVIQDMRFSAEVKPGKMMG